MSAGAGERKEGGESQRRSRQRTGPEGGYGGYHVHVRIRSEQKQAEACGQWSVSRWVWAWAWAWAWLQAQAASPTGSLPLRHKQALGTKDTAHLRTSIRQTESLRHSAWSAFDTNIIGPQALPTVIIAQPFKYICLPLPATLDTFPYPTPPTLSRHFPGTLHSSLRPPAQQRFVPKAN